ncbi:MAG: hypothetical protein KKF44_08270, partial [Nanoarchaeota archaeon]|nr:hypothetical protein [Nanoarchaeota archaeon]
MLKKKGDLTINMIFVILITIISIVLLLGVFSTKLPTFAKSIYCKTFFYIHSSAFIPKNMRADQDYCRFMAGPVDTEIVTSADDINLTLAAQIVACWKEMEYGEFNKDFL